MMFGFGLWELILLGVIIVAIFGLNRVPTIARNAGRVHGLTQRLKRQYPWLGRVPWLSRFFR
ncbi:MAG: twin-arginine translocase TatA/TatE family subunit [Desulfuromusa sp.]|jgi:Sec-independent protein translocase protein TatA|nr:twin-arginine translocase TatA/TatE family subunit [Desulfuromusa sp.]